MSTTHCESCGSTDYEDLHTGDQGYTACCNELQCDGRTQYRWGNDRITVMACCASTARPQMEAKDVHDYWRKG